MNGRPATAYLDGSDIYPESSIVRRVRIARVNLALNPLNSTPVPRDIWRVGVRDATGAVAVTSEPGVEAVVLLAVPAGCHVGVDVGAVR